MNHFSIALFLVIATIFYTGCTNPKTTNTIDKSNDSVTNSPISSSLTSPSASAVSDSNIKEISLDSYAFGFSPSTIEINKGDKVKINVNNKGGFHDFQIPDLGVEKITPENKITSVEFVAEKSGSFEFICGVGNHASLGQKGTLIVK